MSAEIGEGVRNLSVQRQGQRKTPVPGKRNVLVTSALPYVNNVPHLGNLIGAVLSADVYARYLRQRDVPCIYICGTDEYGTATETKAQEEGLSPKEICDKYNALHRDVYDWFDISFDHFGRTSTPQQTEICQEIFWKTYKNGYIVDGELEQLFCNKDQRFLADRFVTGTCHLCGYEDARGDQCDNCGRLLNPIELISPKCSTCKTEPEIRKTKHLFLNLPELKDSLEKYVKETSVAGAWTQNSITMTQTWLREGLRQRCITRDLKWGTPVPLEGYTDKVFYVWFDAPIGYISITATYTDEWRKWWCDETGDVELVQFMGKDNVPFHTVIFPSTLIATGSKWTMMHHISTTEYLNYEDGKFSKRNGIGVFGNDAKNTGIPAEVWRYYLLSNRPELADSTFLWADFVAKNNDELLKNLGNFINRTVSFLHKNFDATMPKITQTAEDEEVIKSINTDLKDYIEAMDKVSLKAGIKKAMLISKIGNQYLQTNQPWTLEKARAGSVLGFAANLVHLLADILEPFLGSAWSLKVYKMLGVEHEEAANQISSEFTFKLREGQKLGTPELLFREIRDKERDELRRKYAGSQNERSQRNAVASSENTFRLDLRVGTVKEAIEHPESTSLFICDVDVGENGSLRKLVAGLRDVYKREDLLDRKVVVVCNMAPTRLAGIDSQGMLLCAEKKKAVSLVEIRDGTVGERLSPEGVEVSLAQALDRKSFSAASKGLRVGSGGSIVYDKTHALQTESKAQAGSGGVPEGGKLK
eukprot:CAMPEP_0198735602 /NCGR_PEP_ID=MMETSP1475-20131203/60763_1 /TAXON_ID= ORGANISM="Unidentified sp., Strain CCMP1999" /NCGR_SAMPLE_ID=MMETSP1475 /ASSEMBLY_ACC=CAM_ASM_001111 /LENGTH=757 /DNA_ID=CAMNT_0044499289 /DNA_START=187 /DNA_END=2460 /DNA_ORIENTATION=-